MRIGVNSSYGVNTDAEGKATRCQSSVPQEANVLGPLGTLRYTATGASIGAVGGVALGGVAAAITAPIGGWLGFMVARESDWYATRDNLVTNEEWKNGQAELAASGCNVSNTVYAPGSRGSAEAAAKK